MSLTIRYPQFHPSNTRTICQTVQSSTNSINTPILIRHPDDWASSAFRCSDTGRLTSDLPFPNRSFDPRFGADLFPFGPVHLVQSQFGRPAPLQPVRARLKSRVRVHSTVHHRAWQAPNQSLDAFLRTSTLTEQPTIKHPRFHAPLSTGRQPWLSSKMRERRPWQKAYIASVTTTSS
ncbi:hypothetical protein BO94DRAFT_358396 [Aspergillus sclerotioniger CBS 115572]|uniref:Uncharacterized protein n=1 Tax=Aspergillus sclerotioniger CBS 115572 TaxID=1450535 RepID=A0A317X3U2_9EURO|nr:hypothetical protein BO94DRAFT_358396 [Aspergillus sclerotioniger CBS 115572]PWY93015.1 hypothetical protein BO94DRAFT_358396 [Aspergillus sclerotioniger CBS 115572]